MGSDGLRGSAVQPATATMSSRVCRKQRHAPQLNGGVQSGAITVLLLPPLLTAASCSTGSSRSCSYITAEF